jgi:hypothetical protein
LSTHDPYRPFQELHGAILAKRDGTRTLYTFYSAIPEGPELHDDPAAASLECSRYEFGETITLAAKIVAQLGFDGALYLHAAGDPGEDYEDHPIIGEILFHDAEPVVYVRPKAISNHYDVRNIDVSGFLFQDEPATVNTNDPTGFVRDALAARDVDNEGKCSCCGKPPETAALTADEANRQEREEPIREKTRSEQEASRDPDISVNPYTTNEETYTFARFEQGKRTLSEMSQWLENQGGLTTHLAGTIVMVLYGEMSDPGSTYRQISEVGYRPKDDVSVIEVEDSEEDMDLVIEVRQAHKH